MCTGRNPEFEDLDPDSNLLVSGDTCSYFTIDSYNSTFTNHNQYSLLNQNIQSFHAKKDHFEALLSSLNNSFHTILLTETWNTAINVSLCCLEGYDAVHTYRTQPTPHRGGVGGGLTIFYKANLYKARKIEELSLCNATIETCVAQLFRSDLRDPEGHFIIGVYRPHTDTIENFIDSLQQILENPIFQNKTIILAGDININITGAHNSSIQNYLSLLSSLNFIPAITKPTRFPINNNNSSLPTTLDHIFINKIINFQSAIFDYDLSDHCGTALNCYLYDTVNHSETLHRVTFRPFSESNFANLESKLTNTDWDALLQSDDVNIQFDTFSRYINCSYQSHFPLKTKFISDKRIKNQWLTNATLEKIKQKSHYFNLYKRGHITKQVNNTFKNRLNKDIKRDKNNFHLKLFENAKKNMKKSWKILKNLLGCKVDKRNANLIFDHIVTDTDKLNAVNNFNDFFSSIGSELAAGIHNNETSPIENITLNPHSFFLFSPSELEISKILANLKLTKSHIDVLPVKLFKNLSNALLYPLQKIIEVSFRSGVFPDQLKVARITPIHKKGDYDIPSNFRPISSLPYISKIYEKLMANRLLSFCKKFNVISGVQFGFQPGVATSDAIFKITESIYEALDNNSPYIGIVGH